MAKLQGTPCWYELATSEGSLGAAETFYGEVLGWTCQDAGMEGFDYHLASAGGDMVAGLMAMPADIGEMPPFWMIYFAVDEADAAAARGVGEWAPAAMPWRAVVDEVGDALGEARLEVRDALLVGDGNWWSYLCLDPSCCPPEGSRRSGPGSRAAAAAAYAGLSAVSGREQLEALLTPAPDDALERMASLVEVAEGAEFQAVLADRQASHRRSVIRAIFAAARLHSLDEPSAEHRLTVDQIARFGVALGDIEVRDACWLAMEGGRIPPTGLWRHLAQSLPQPYDAQPLFLLGWQEWRAGNGPLAGIAAARALRSRLPADPLG